MPIKHITIMKQLFLTLLCLGCLTASAQSLTITPDRQLVYTTFENGDRIPDYSFCGYEASEKEIPLVPARVKVAHQTGDATERIQRAIDYVSALPLSPDGFRGAVVLEKGVYRLEGGLQINASGVVLRGSGYGEDETVLFAAGTDRTTLIRIAGQPSYSPRPDSIPITGSYLPLNATVIPLPAGHPFRKGDRIVVTRPSTEKWLQDIGADKIGFYVDYQLTHWTAGDFDIRWERTVADVQATAITIDVPLTQSLSEEYGMGYVSHDRQPGRIRQVGVENLRCVSEYNPANSEDENHRWMALTVENAEDGWIRRVTGQHFVSSIVALWDGVRRFTVEDCKCLQPVGEIGGYRRYAFQTLGQQTLFQRCYAEYGYHDFSVGFTVPGPNAFVQCYAYRAYDFSGTLGGWSSGVLFDRVTVDGAALKITFRDVDGQGGGWSGANSLCWEARVPQLHLMTPPKAHNWAFGTWGQGYGNGSHEMPRTFMRPPSFYYAQLEARTGKASPESQKILSLRDLPLEETDPPYTARMSKRSEKPELLMDQWIDTLAARYPLPSFDAKIKDISSLAEKKPAAATPITRKISIENGVIMRDGQPLSGQRQRTQRTALWRGNTRPSNIQSAGVHLSRFVPGRIGRGLTDDLDSVAAFLTDRNIVALNHFPALWYERRRDDHGRSRRADADVWAPFYEQPFSRSGQGEAFDRLSRYDLDQFNPWYWLRVKQFSDIADQKGILLIQDHYLQHNIIEEGAHWADYPWRAANNVNGFSFPENTYYAGDKRVFMADQFYDTSNEKLVRYHRQNIRKYLDELGKNNNVVHHLGMEYTGPARFVRFWLDIIGEWEKENQTDVKTMLSATKEVTDSILAEPRYAALLDIIEIRQWHYRADGSLYAPAGNVSLTERQYARIMDVGEDNFDAVYRAVKEYRTKYPDKAVVYSHRKTPEKDRASYLAGGSLCAVPAEDLETQPAAAQPEPSRQQTLEAMKKATRFMVEKVGPQGAYVWAYAADLSRRWGELEAYPTMGWVQSPGTGSMGHLLLDAYHATGDEYYYQAAAKVAQTLIDAQLPCGGWNYMFDLAGEDSLKKWYATIGRQAWRMEEFQHYYGNATFDDGGTICAAELLLRMFVEKKDPAFRPALDRAIRFVLQSQYPSGGWPQRYPLMHDHVFLGKADYTPFITLNDDVCLDNIEFLLQCRQAIGLDSITEPIDRAMDLLIRLQTPPPYAGWADQYFVDDLKPAHARSYEPQALNTTTTMEMIDLLMKYYRLTGNKKFLAGIPQAIDFLETLKLSDADIQRAGRTLRDTALIFIPRYVNAETGIPQFIHRKGSNIANGHYYFDQEDLRQTVTHISSFATANIAALRLAYDEILKTPVDELTKDSPYLHGNALPLPKYYSNAPFRFRSQTATDIIGAMNEDGCWLVPLTMTSNPYKAVPNMPKSEETKYATTRVGDEYDTSTYPLENPVLSISMQAYINNMMRLILHADSLK
jgi:PelA/Pel-15E family pectate lyase